MKNILVATDFSERSDRALRRATLLARQTRAAICLLHVVDDDQPAWFVEQEHDSSVRLLQEQAKTVREVDGVACEARVVFGSAFAGIAAATQTIGSDLLVIGPHRRQALRDVFVGTTAERTIRAVNCPVLMANATPTTAYRNVLLATDLSDTSRDVIHTFGSLGMDDGSARSLIHVFHDSAVRLVRAQAFAHDDKNPFYRKRLAAALADVTGFMERLDPGVRMTLTPMIRHEDTLPAFEILAAARERSADLIVVGTRRKGHLEKLVLGSVAEEVLRSARQDVLAVPEKEP